MINIKSTLLGYDDNQKIKNIKKIFNIDAKKSCRKHISKEQQSGRIFPIVCFSRQLIILFAHSLFLVISLNVFVS